ncbi:MAG: hypothetical protein AB8G16_12620 [Gammaproteobacteria bacterium]
MTQYQPLFRVALEHDYFQAPESMGTVCVCDPRSEALAHACGLVIKVGVDGAVIYFDASNRTALEMTIADSQKPACLWFRLQTDNPLMHYCTEPRSPEPGSAFFFTNAAGSDQQAAPTQGLAIHDKVTIDDVVSLDDERLSAVVTTHDRLHPPYAFVCIALADLPTLSDTAVASDFIIRFAARETHWKYYLVANAPTRQWAVKSTEHGAAVDSTAIEFIRRTERLPDGRECATFTSKSSIAMRERGTERIELRNVDTDTVEIDRLPVASPQNFSQDTLDGRDVYVSNIFVNL